MHDSAVRTQIWNVDYHYTDTVAVHITSLDGELVPAQSRNPLDVVLAGSNPGVTNVRLTVRPDEVGSPTVVDLAMKSAT
jgi:hypothetical protein